MPNFDPEAVYNATESHDLLIRTQRLGASLAELFSDEPSNKTLHHDGVLMRGHGFSMAGDSVESAVYKSIFAQINARMQTTAMQLASAAGMERSVEFMSTREWMDGIKNTEAQTSGRAWKLWAAEVERSAGTLYRNSLQNLTGTDA